ncbi:hypothetical protein [Micromonospora sediminicola]|uniref:hypothetical protein n=1 Tax=Micromonospora sediminicola TaxID=946078 RepID=UPI00378ACE60
MTDQQITIPEPADGSRVVIDNGPTASYRLRLFWRDDTEAKRWGGHPDERWFDDDNSDPLAWGVVCRNAENVYRVERAPWEPLVQPDDPAKVSVRLVVEQVIRDEVYDRAEFEQAKADDEIDALIDMDASDIDGDSVVVEADGTEHRPY